MIRQMLRVYRKLQVQRRSFRSRLCQSDRYRYAIASGGRLLSTSAVGESVEECPPSAYCYNMTANVAFFVDAIKAGCSTWRCMLARDTCIRTTFQMIPVSFCCCSHDRCNVAENLAYGIKLISSRHSNRVTPQAFKQRKRFLLVALHLCCTIFLLQLLAMIIFSHNICLAALLEEMENLVRVGETVATLVETQEDGEAEMTMAPKRPPLFLVPPPTKSLRKTARRPSVASLELVREKQYTIYLAATMEETQEDGEEGIADGLRKAINDSEMANAEFRNNGYNDNNNNNFNGWGNNYDEKT
ncbi:unnamed protein product [Cylicostephanus goldi]|uniref:Activin types I and II receptor domain-containing protein n=1 Tax=Cylicostephanus goldi TaxID=71465 RepID=A0A3P6S8B5_CYLGO|nr:unnamed protein product [Cylicostephanus goldi]